MKRARTRLITSITYLNIILTIIAILLGIRLVNDLGLLRTLDAHATNLMPVQIESVRGTIPVSIKEPVSGYPAGVCVSPCK
jgi:hypothetical protein